MTDATPRTYWNELTPEDCRVIVRLRLGGMTYEEIVTATSHGRQTIHDVLLDHGLAQTGTYNRAPKPEPGEVFAEGHGPTMWACAKCGYKTDNKHGHPNCYPRSA